MDRDSGEKDMGRNGLIRRSRRMPGGWAARRLDGKKPFSTRKSLGRMGGAATLFLLLVIIIPCGVSAEEGGSLTYRLKWLFNTSVVGDLYADHYGYFENQGLSVEVKAGGPERDAIKELELGYADFGVASADQVIRAIAKGSPVVVICQLFQTNPLQWIYRTDSVTLGGLSDLKGKKIGVTFGGNDEAILRALLAAGGLDEREVNLYSVRYDYTPFYKKEVNIWPVYRNAQGLILADKLAAEGEAVDFFDPSSFGVRFVANSVVTSREMVTDHPETVSRFLSALLAGWQAALATENEEKAIALLQHHDKDTSREMLEKQLAATRRIVAPETGFAIGAIDADAWQQTGEIMRQQELISKDVNIEQALVSNFLPKSQDNNDEK
jgi:NitT/TauT family transport system substrate-binding protein